MIHQLKQIFKAVFRFRDDHIAIRTTAHPHKQFLYRIILQSLSPTSNFVA